jgi:hypothetical protein
MRIDCDKTKLNFSKAVSKAINTLSFDVVIKTMTALHWEWGNLDAHSVEDHKKLIRSLANDAFDALVATAYTESDSCRASGGYCVLVFFDKAKKSIGVNVSFQLSSSTSLWTKVVSL